MTDKEQKKEDSAKTEIKKQYHRLKAQEEAATQLRVEMERICQGGPVSKCISEWKREIQASKESLVNAETKEVVKLQQAIKARTALIEDFENEGKKEVEDARNEMEEFLKGVTEELEKAFGMTKDEMEKMMRLGTSQKEMVLPSELVDQLESMQEKKGSSPASDWLLEQSQAMLKQWKKLE